MTTNRDLTFAIAVPTYRRPEQLKRALLSLIMQTHEKWVATVFDDSGTVEGERVVAELADTRITYCTNAQRAGAAFNIDRSFGGRLENKGDFGYVLEDDNYLLAGFFEHVIDEMVSSNAKIGLFNQRIHDEETGLMPLQCTTRGDWFSSGWIRPVDLHASLLLMEGLSNGGVVWRLNARVKLEVGEYVSYTTLHEACRSLLIQENLWYSSRALAVWTKNSPTATARVNEKNRVVSRGRNSIINKVIAWHGKAAIERALMWTDSTRSRKHLICSLAHAGCWSMAWSLDNAFFLKYLKPAIKGVVLRRIVSDPCREFINSLN